MEDTIVKDEPVIEAPKVEEVVTESTPPGAKTDSALLLESLHKEREKRRELEAEIEKIKNTSTGDDVYSDEGKAILGRMALLEREILANKQKSELQTLQSKYPALKDKSAEFDEYLENNTGMRLDVAAKAFLVENELLNQPAPRKGLEKESGGTRTQPKSGMSAEEIEELRVNNYREYAKRLKAGTLGN